MKSARPISANTWFGGRSLGDSQFSPDRSQVAFVTAIDSTAELALIRLEDGLEEWLPLTPPIKRVGSSGGGVFRWMPDQSGIVYIGSDGCINRYNFESNSCNAITRWPDLSTALSVSPDGSHVAFVVDTHDVAVVETDANNSWPRRLSSDADFVFDPVWSQDSKWVAWHEWSVPNMPWDGGRIVARHADGSGPIVHVAGGDNTSVQQPRFSPDGKYLSFISDANGWANVWVCDTQTFENARPLVEEAFEHATPSWGPGQRSYCWMDDAKTIVYSRNEGGLGRLRRFSLETGESLAICDGHYSGLSGGIESVVGIADGPRIAQSVEVVDINKNTTKQIARGPLHGIERAGSLPENVEWTASDGTTIHGRLYRADESPSNPLLVYVHGGPTGQSLATLFPRCAYFVERGWNVLVPDYRGSTGWGRGYTQAMRNKWCDLDVTDVSSGIEAALANGWGVQGKIAIFGGSAGGTTSLLVLINNPGLCEAGIIIYPVTDLLDFETSRFEAHYFDSLVGELPESFQKYVQSSPLTHAAKIKEPILLLHGDSDRDVPVSQSTRLAEKIQQAGGTVELHIYEGEGHGWRNNETNIDELERIESFLRRHVVHGKSDQEENQ